MPSLDPLAQQVLGDVLLDFRAKKLNSDALTDGYVGATLSTLIAKYCDGDSMSKVDFDLALKELETEEFVKTGPMAPYQNRPDSAVAIFAMFSKREYVYLTEKGYRAAQRVKSSSKTSAKTTVNIHGGNFHQSPISVGEQATQSVIVNIEDQSEVVGQLLQLLERAGIPIDEACRQEVKKLVEVTYKGEVATAKPIFARLFGAMTEGAKQVAWNVLSAIIAKQLGM